MHCLSFLALTLLANRGCRWLGPDPQNIAELIKQVGAYLESSREFLKWDLTAYGDEGRVQAFQRSIHRFVFRWVCEQRLQYSKCAVAAMVQVEPRAIERKTNVSTIGREIQDPLSQSSRNRQTAMGALRKWLVASAVQPLADLGMALGDLTSHGPAQNSGMGRKTSADLVTTK